MIMHERLLMYNYQDYERNHKRRGLFSVFSHVYHTNFTLVLYYHNKRQGGIDIEK